MYLKALTLKGFKSFADKTDLNFEPGVTVVVGPNGSGKSNLVDAVAWVLGAQGARALRGAKMDDVIFAGTTKKPALGRAEVSLTIDNSDNTLPIDFTEVTITRTLFRSGESEYRLNDVPCRLLDIQELLSDSRIGRTQHVIVGQGQLDSVLNARPEDRRAIIEEAAGVLKYRKRREKSQRRLEATEGNLARLTDLVREVRRQLSPLEKQADAAKRHDGVRDELRAIQLFISGQEVKGLKNSLERISNERVQYKEQEQKLLAELSQLDMKVIESEAALVQVGDSEVTGWLTRAERLVSRTSAMNSMLIERKRTVTALLEASADESVVESLHAEKENLEESLSGLSSLLEELMPRLQALRTQNLELENEYQKLLDEEPSKDAQQTYESTAKEHQARLDSINALKNRLQSESARLESVVQRISVLEQDHQDAQEILENDSQSLSKIETEHQQVISFLEVASAQYQDLEKKFGSLQKDAAKSKAQFELISETYDSNNQTAGIENVRNVDGVLGTLLENIEIDPNAEKACAVVLSDLANSIVVDSAEGARNVMASLSSNELSASLFVLGSIFRDQRTSLPQGVTPITRFIRSSNPRIEQSIHTALSNVVYVEGDWRGACEVALSNPDLVVVTSNGDKFGGSSAWSFGKATAKTITAKDVEDAKRTNEELQAQLQDCEISLQRLKEEKFQLENNERVLASQISEIKSRCEIARKTLQTTQSAMSARRSEQEQLRLSVEQLNEQISSGESQISEISLRLGKLNEQKENEQQFLIDFQNKKQAFNVIHNEKKHQLQQLEIQIETTKSRQSDTRKKLEEVTQRIAKDPEQEQIAKARRQKLLDQLETISSLQLRVASVSEKSQHARNVLDEERQKQNRKAHESTAVLEQIRSQRKDTEKELVETRDRLQKGDIQEAEFRTRLTNTIEQIRTVHDCEPEVAMDADMPEVAEGVPLAVRARELERELKIMGPINPLAIQEFEELNERYSFLTEQLEDVKAARKELHKVIKTIDNEIVVVFEKAFEDVQKHFSDLFSTLFSGGAGRLTLTDPNDMLNTGIDMEARPSGKNVRRLSLLSGGERSLTALAFLFAVFRSRPSPFYIMDEVEAALDEPNLMRFLDLVAEFRNDAQLLIVSHQKKTMEAADELYGVSMAPGGSSRAIKQKIEKTSSVGHEKVDVDLVAEHAKESLETDSETEETPILESSI